MIPNTTRTPKHEVEAMLRDIAFVLKLSRQTAAEIRADHGEPADTEPADVPVNRIAGLVARV